MIRAEIIPDAPRAAGDPPRSRNHRLGLLAAAVAALALIWIGMRVFTSGPASAPAMTDARHSAPPGQAVPLNAGGPSPEPEETKAEDPAPIERASPIAGTSLGRDEPIEEVVPTPVPSALQTIRGTVRVLVQVTIDERGKVTAATPEDPGPSRYFERLSVEAARKWGFAPAESNEQRTMLLRFYFTREGATARVDR